MLIFRAADASACCCHYATAFAARANAPLFCCRCCRCCHAAFSYAAVATAAVRRRDAGAINADIAACFVDAARCCCLPHVLPSAAACCCYCLHYCHFRLLLTAIATSRHTPIRRRRRHCRHYFIFAGHCLPPALSFRHLAFSLPARCHQIRCSFIIRCFCSAAAIIAATRHAAIIFAASVACGGALTRITLRRRGAAAARFRAPLRSARDTREAARAMSARYAARVSARCARAAARCCACQRCLAASLTPLLRVRANGAMPMFTSLCYYAISRRCHAAMVITLHMLLLLHVYIAAVAAIRCAVIAAIICCHFLRHARCSAVAGADVAPC